MQVSDTQSEPLSLLISASLYSIFNSIVAVEKPLNPLTPKIRFLILPFGCYKFPCNLVIRIWH